MNLSDGNSLSLRLSLLESLTYGEADGSSASSSSSILRRSCTAQEQFQHDIEKYRSIVQFVEEYRSNKAFLQPSIYNLSKGKVGDSTPSQNFISQSNSPSATPLTIPEIDQSSLLSTQSIIALLLDSEQDLRQLDRDLRLCEHHQEKGTAGAGKLADHEKLKSRLASLVEHMTTLTQAEKEVESRVLHLMELYNQQIDVMSKLFIHWDGLLNQTEDALSRKERSRQV